MKILQAAEAVHPSFGGIAEGIYQQGIELRALGHEVDVVSGDDEPVQRLCEGGSKHFAFKPTHQTWRWSRGLRGWLKDNIRNYDVVVLNGLWMGPLYEAGRAAHQSKVPYVVMPHGMLDPYFLTSAKQRVVKRLYWTLAEGRAVRGAKGLFFTAEGEEQQARASYPLEGVRSWQVGYGIRDPERWASPQGISREGLRLLFMSRIHPKKGLELTIKGLSQSPSHVKLDICGEGDPAYEAELRKLSEPLGKRVTWHGFTSGEEKWRHIQECDAMILTSHQENFGVIVAEAMSLGRPVIISREVNIWREVESDGAGLCCAAEVGSVAEAIAEFVRLSDDERLEMGRRGRSSFLNRYTIQSSVARFEAALKEAIK